MHETLLLIRKQAKCVGGHIRKAEIEKLKKEEKKKRTKLQRLRNKNTGRLAYQAKRKWGKK
jgi:hypothetical protein